MPKSDHPISETVLIRNSWGPGYIGVLDKIDDEGAWLKTEKGPIYFPKDRGIVIERVRVVDGIAYKGV